MQMSSAKEINQEIVSGIANILNIYFIYVCLILKTKTICSTIYKSCKLYLDSVSFDYRALSKLRVPTSLITISETSDDSYIGTYY